jgi:hypothetical protein
VSGDLKFRPLWPDVSFYHLALSENGKLAMKSSWISKSDHEHASKYIWQKKSGLNI